MKQRIFAFLLGLAIAVATASTVQAGPEPPRDYQGAVEATASMVGNSQAQQLAQKHGLNIVNVTWEDTGRYKNSSVGPNISDMTIQVQQMDPRSKQVRLSCMPVIRFPNYSDRSADISPDHFYLLVGNEKGRPLRKVSLRDFLGNVRYYLTDGKSWTGKGESLLAPRDSHVLVSAQACFLPVPKQGKAEFNAVLFNYQSYEGDPAVLTILATREGTSVTVIDNKRDGFAAGRTWGQRLFFNEKGQRASMTGERMSDFASHTSTSGHQTPQAAGQEGLNMVLLIQVPLKQKHPMRMGYGCDDCAPCPTAGATQQSERSNVEAAVIGHGKVEGPFTEIAGLPIERDPSFPIRVTVQFYKATSNGVVNADDMKSIADQIDRVYKKADYVGSLVTGGETRRPTEYDGPKHQPPGWWNAFWKRYEKNTGQSRQDAMQMLQNLLGPGWRALPVAQIVETLNRPR